MADVGEILLLVILSICAVLIGLAILGAVIVFGLALLVWFFQEMNRERPLAGLLIFIPGLAMVITGAITTRDNIPTAIGLILGGLLLVYASVKVAFSKPGTS